jgi:hypothetical protein
MENNNEKTMVCVVCEKEKLITSFSIYGRKGFRRKVCKVCINQGLTMKDIKISETKLCIACDVKKPINQFYRNNALIDGYEKRCKSCKINNISSRVKAEPKSFGEKYNAEVTMNLVGLREDDFRSTYLFLQSIGYDLSRNLHEQFCEKYNLPVNPVPYTTKYHFSPKQLGLV